MDEFVGKSIPADPIEILNQQEWTWDSKKNTLASVAPVAEDFTSNVAMAEVFKGQISMNRDIRKSVRVSGVEIVINADGQAEIGGKANVDKLIREGLNVGETFQSKGRGA